MHVGRVFQMATSYSVSNCNAPRSCANRMRPISTRSALARLIPSAFQTFVAFIRCPGPEDVRALLSMQAPGLGYAEDWTTSVVHYCLRCSYGAPHRHEPSDGHEHDDSWQVERSIGIAAQSRHTVDKLLADWKRAGVERIVDLVDSREQTAPERVDGYAWWLGPDDHTDDDADD